MTNSMHDVLGALTCALNNEPIPDLDEEAIKEAKQQAVLSLICNNVQAIPFIAQNVKLMWEQQQLSSVFNNIPYFILKGSCAAIYYPVPIRRSFGDIDIIVSPSYFSDAYLALKRAGYTLVNHDDRHIHFKNNGINIELHQKFTVQNAIKQEQVIDEWIYSATPIIGRFGKYSFPMLPDHLNGLVLLVHISQHLEEGLGLRHFVDWVMFVNKYLSDSEWQSFQELTDQLGLTTLAKVSARFGQKFLNMNQEITWCLDIDDDTVDMLLDYIYECGNFGRKDRNNNTMIMVMIHSRGVKGFFSNLQRRGVANWESAQRHSCLRPFAWIYQLFRYFDKGIKKGGLKNIRSNIITSRKRNQLFDRLGVTRFAIKE